MSQNNALLGRVGRGRTAFDWAICAAGRPSKAGPGHCAAATAARRAGGRRAIGPCRSSHLCRPRLVRTRRPHMETAGLRVSQWVYLGTGRRVGRPGPCIGRARSSDTVPHGVRHHPGPRSGNHKLADRRSGLHRTRTAIRESCRGARGAMTPAPTARCVVPWCGQPRKVTRQQRQPIPSRSHRRMAGMYPGLSSPGTAGASGGE